MAENGSPDALPTSSGADENHSEHEENNSSVLQSLSSSNELPITFLVRFVKPFDGSREDLSAFISDCNKAFALASPNQKYVLLDYILTQISGKAKAACINRSFKTWDDLKTFLKTMYQDRKHYSQLLCELTNLKQNFNESVSQFVCRVETCLKRTINATQQQNPSETSLEGRLELLNEIALNRFVYFSLPSITNVLRVRELKTLNEAISTAVAEEQVQNMYQSRNHFKPFNNIKLNANNGNIRTNKPQSRNLHVVQNHSHLRANPQPSTSAANDTNSPMEVKVCKYCKAKGHLISECRKREYNNNRKKQTFGNNSKNLNSAPEEVALLESLH